MDFKKGLTGRFPTLFKKQPSTNTQESPFKKVSLYDALKNSYNPADHLGDYVIDKDLSNDNQQVYHRPQDNKLLVSIAGTHNLSDVGTDLALLAGKLKDTSRYKEAANVLAKAKEKYNTNADIVGHSLGGGIGQYAAGDGDRVLTYNKGATFGQPTRDNETAYRSGGDLISALGSGIKTIGSNIYNPFSASGIGKALDSHNLDNIKDENIFI